MHEELKNSDIDFMACRPPNSYVPRPINSDFVIRSQVSYSSAKPILKKSKSMRFPPPKPETEDKPVKTVKFSSKSEIILVKSYKAYNLNQVHKNVRKGCTCLIF